MIHAAALDPKAAPICLLTREWAERRAEKPAEFLDLVTSEASIEGGTEYRLPAGVSTWNRVEAYIREEGECCPFLSFHACEDGDDIRLKILWPEEVWK